MSILIERLKAEVEADTGSAVRSLTALEGTLDTVARDRTATVDVDIDRNGITALTDFNSEMSKMGPNVQDLLPDLNNLGGGFGGIGGGARMGSAAMGSFGASMAAIGIQLVAFAALIPFLIGAINALAGAIVALTAALAPLAGVLATLPALFGAAAAGIGTLFLGLGGVVGAVSQFTKAQDAATGSGRSATATALEHAAALRGLREATTNLAQAQLELKEATEAVAEAREKALEDLEQTQLNYEQALLDEERATIRLRKAREALAKAEGKVKDATIKTTKLTDDFTGKVYEVGVAAEVSADEAENLAAAQLEVKDAELAVRQANINSREAREDLNEANKKGVEGSDAVTEANKRLQRAQWGVEAATDAVAAAQDRLTRGTVAGSSAMAKYNQALAKLSPKAQALATWIIKHMVPAFQEIKKAAQEAIAPGVLAGLKSMRGFFPILKDAVTDFGETIGTVFAEVAKDMSTPDSMKQWETILAHFNTLIGDMGRGFGQVLRIFRELIVAAAPLTEWISKGILGALTDLGDWLEKNRTKTRGFFTGLKGPLTTVKNIIGNLGKAFVNILKAAKPTGDSLLKTFEKITAQWVKWTGDKQNQKTMSDWFKNAAEMMGDLAGFFVELVKQWLSFTSDKEFLETFKETLKSMKEALPGIIQFMKDAAKLVENFANMVEVLAKAYGWLRKIATFKLDDKIKSGEGIFPTKNWKSRLNDFRGWYDRNVNKWLKDRWEDVRGFFTRNHARFGFDYKERFNAAKGWVQEKWREFKEWFWDRPIRINWSDLTDGLTSALNWVIRQWNKLDFSIKVGTGPFQFDTGDILPDISEIQRQYGGRVKKGHPYIVGEKRPELFVPDQDGSVQMRVPDTITGQAGGLTEAQLQRILEAAMQNAKAPVNIDQTFMEKQDPDLLSAALAWRLQ